jgi:hypothetical protein
MGKILKHLIQGNKMELKNIDRYKDAKTSELRTYSLKKLSEIYQGKDSDLQNCLISEVELLFSLYKKIKKSNFKEYIIKNSKSKEYINLYNNAIDCFLNFNHAFFIRYINEKDEIEKKKAYYYIGSSQVHLTKLQSQYNQLVYRKQRREYFFAMAISIIALIATIIFGIVSLK